MGDMQPLVLGLDGNDPKKQFEAEELNKQGKVNVKEGEQEEVGDEDAEVLEELPGWLPDGWIMEVHRGNDGITYRYYTSPVSGYGFSTKMETLNYLFSEMDECALESQACAEDNDLHRMHTWLPDGWVIEVRAGGKKMDKMYKFYLHMPTGIRFFSKEDVLHYANGGKTSRCYEKGLCDTSSEDNILAQVEFNPDGLPEGWVKEIIFRKCNDGIRKDSYFTDPISHHVFRTMKSVLSYLETGEITKHAYIPRRSVTDLYCFDKCTDMPQSMLKRLKVQGETKQNSMKASVLDKKLSNDDGLSNHCVSSDLDPQSEPEQRKPVTIKAIGKEVDKRRSGRPLKSIKRTSGSTETLKTIGKKAVKSKVIKRLTAERGTSASLSLSAEPKQKFKTIQATGKGLVTPESTKRPRGRPRKIVKQTNKNTSDCGKSLHKEAHIVVKKELDIGGGEHVPMEPTLEYNEREKRTMVIQEVNIIGRSLSQRRRERLGLMTHTDLHDQENGKLTVAGDKLAYSSVQKVYMRRSSKHTPGLNKE